MGEGDPKGMWEALTTLYKKRHGFLYLCFDISVFLYLISYFYHYTDSAFDGQIRMISTILLAFFGLILWSQKLGYMSPATLWYLLFTGWALASALWAKNAALTTSLSVTLIRVILFGHFLSIRIEDDDDIEQFLNLYVIATIYMCVNIFIKAINYYTLANIMATRFGDNFGYNSNMTSMLGCIAIFICFHKIKIKRHNLLNVLIIAFLLAILVLTGSKKGFFGLAIGLVLLAQFKNIGSKRIKRLFVVTLVIVGMYALVMSVPVLYDQIGNRIELMLKSVEGDSMASYSTTSRLMLLKQAFSTWIDHFFLGVGLNNFELYQTVKAGYYAHSNYLELLADVGIVGFLLFYIYPIKSVISAVDYDNDLHVTVRTICVLELIYETACVSYQDFRVLIFLWLLPFMLTNPLIIKLGNR